MKNKRNMDPPIYIEKTILEITFKKTDNEYQVYEHPIYGELRLQIKYGFPGYLKAGTKGKFKYTQIGSNGKTEFIPNDK